MKEYTVRVTGSVAGVYKVAADTEDNAHEAASKLFLAEMMVGNWDDEIDIVCTQNEEDDEGCDRTYDAEKILKVAEYGDLKGVYEIILED